MRERAEVGVAELADQRVFVAEMKVDRGWRIFDAVSDASHRDGLIALGEKDLAFEWLDRAYDERDENYIHLKDDPRLDDLRSDPRFAERLRLIRLAS